jgi:hypothetical protein
VVPRNGSFIAEHWNLSGQLRPSGEHRTQVPVSELNMCYFFVSFSAHSLFPKRSLDAYFQDQPFIRTLTEVILYVTTHLQEYSENKKFSEYLLLKSKLVSLAQLRDKLLNPDVSTVRKQNNAASFPTSFLHFFPFFLFIGHQMLMGSLWHAGRQEKVPRKSSGGNRLAENVH